MTDLMVTQLLVAWHTQNTKITLLILTNQGKNTSHANLIGQLDKDKMKLKRNFQTKNQTNKFNREQYSNLMNDDSTLITRSMLPSVAERANMHETHSVFGDIIVCTIGYLLQNPNMSNYNPKLKSHRTRESIETSSGRDYQTEYDQPVYGKSKNE